jgi:hypothetical protein
MSDASKVRPGPTFTRNHQLAILLVRHLGVNGAIQACYSNQWYGVLRAIEEQNGDCGSAA